MAVATKFKISSAVSVFVRPGVSAEQKLTGLQMVSSLEPFDRVTLVFCLVKDADPNVKQAAGAVFAKLSDSDILLYIDSSDAHPSVLDAVAKVHHANPWVVQALLGNENLSDPARVFLLGRELTPPEVPVEPPAVAVDNESVAQSLSEELQTQPNDMSDEADDASDEVPAEIDEDDEQFLSKYKIAMEMGISEKIKMALSGDKEWRSILIKDSNKLVSGSVVKNPRITDGEILTILKVGVQNDEIIRLICANKEWVKNYQIRKALIDCPKTPLPNSLRYLSTLNEKDIAGYAKSKNISSVLSTQAKRLILAKKR
jgi:hypothetical protein